MSTTIVETPWCPAGLQHGSKPWSLDDVKITDHLGEGATSLVVCCRHAGHEPEMALKMYRRDCMSEPQCKQVLHEVTVHAKLNHPRVVPLYAAFQDDDGIYLIQELLPGKNVSKMVFAGGGHLTEQLAVSAVIAPLVSALCYLHGKGLVHRDVKTENLLLDERHTARLADFGFTCSVENGPVQGCVGTLDYQAPEIVQLQRGQGSQGYGQPADVWAVGVAAYEVLVGAGPFEAPSKQATYDKILTAQPSLPSHLSAAARDFISQALNKEPAARPTAEQLSKHAWLAPALASESMLKAGSVSDAAPAVSLVINAAQ